MSRCPSCETTARRERAAQRAAGELEGRPDRNGRVVAFSEEEIKRRSELAKRMHAEGRFGGAVIGRNGGKSLGRHRINDALLDYFRQGEKQELVIKAFESNLKGKNKALRLRAAESILRTESMQDERMLRERGGAVDPASMPQEELMEFVAQGLQAMIERGEIPVDVQLGEDSVEEIQ
jgi:hypothetical protein